MVSSFPGTLKPRSGESRQPFVNVHLQETNNGVDAARVLSAGFPTRPRRQKHM
jgi:hypothetical protein